MLGQSLAKGKAMEMAGPRWGEGRGLPFEGVEATRSKVMRRLKLIVRLGVWRRMTLQ